MAQSSRRCKKPRQKAIKPSALRLIVRCHQPVLLFATLRSRLAVGGVFRLLPAPEYIRRAFRVELHAINLVPIAESLIGIGCA